MGLIFASATLHFPWHWHFNVWLVYGV